MSVSDPLLKTLKLQILELHHSSQFFSTTDSIEGNEAVEGCSSISRLNTSGDGNGNGSNCNNDLRCASDTNSSINYEEPITDSHPFLIPLCRTLEEVFRKGLRPTSSSLLSLSVKKDDYWRWIEFLATAEQKIPPPLRATVEAAKNDPRVLTYVGRGRLFLRLCLAKRTLVPLMELVVGGLFQRAFDDTHYHSESSILGNDILSQIFASLVRQLATFNFRLDLSNASFLDDSWQLPLRKTYEMVPCSDLGVILKYVMGRVMVAAVEPGSVGGEDKKIEAGDVFDEIFGKCLRKVKRGRVANLMADNRGLPVRLTVIKCKLGSGDIYPPLMNIVRQMSNELEIMRILKEQDEMRSRAKPPSTILEDDESDMVPAQNPMDNPTYRVRYLGEVFVGSSGGVDRIEEGVGMALREYKDTNTRVILHLGEKDVVVSHEKTADDNGKQALKHSYPEISSCGRRVDCRKFFAYIAGETTCSISTKFMCHVFEAASEVESKNILCGIAQGFERTHWAI